MANAMMKDAGLNDEADILQMEAVLSNSVLDSQIIFITCYLINN